MFLETLVRFLDDHLGKSDFPGDSSLNGLQVEGKKRIKKVALAVDACEQSIRGAARRGADILIVHHGLFWGEAAPITGIMATRVRLLIQSGLSLYACHLPLDCHPEIGNNARLAEMLEIREPVPFGHYKGHDIGLLGALPRPVTAPSFAARVRRLLHAPVRTFAFGSPRMTTLGIVSGNGAFLIEAASEAGCDAFLTGEPTYASYHPARETGMNLFCAGHYATETVGLESLGTVIKRELDLPVTFIELPSEL